MLSTRSILALAAAVLGCTGGSEPRADSDRDEPEPQVEQPAVAVARHSVNLGGASCWIRDDRRLVCFGFDSDGSLGGPAPGVSFGDPRVVPDLQELASIAGHGLRTCAVDVAGKVWCFGSLHAGPRHLWARAPPRHALAMQSHFASDVEHAVDGEGRLLRYVIADARWSFADGIEGSVEFELSGGGLGCGRTEAGVIQCFYEYRSSSAPMPVLHVEGIEDPIDISSEMVVLDRSGSTYRVDIPGGVWEVARTATDVVSLSGDCGLHSSGAVSCWLGEPEPRRLTTMPPARAVVRDGPQVCVIAASDDSVHCQEIDRKARRVSHLSPAHALVAYDDLWCALVDGQVRCVNERFARAQVPELRGEELFAARWGLCVRTGGRVRCWEKKWELDREYLYDPPLDDAIGFASFNERPCARRPDGSLLCLSHEGYGELHAGPVAGLGEVAEVALGYGFACARERSGAVRCWGVHAVDGQLGDGREQPTLTPTAVSGIDDAIDIDAAASTACAVRSNGELACWGLVADEDGLATVAQTTPRLVHRIADAAEVALDVGRARRLSLCVRLRDGKVSCSHESKPLTPVAGITDAVHLIGGGATFCVLGSHGEVACWTEDGPPVHFDIHARGLAVAGSRVCADVGDVRGPTCWDLGEHSDEPTPGVAFPFVTNDDPAWSRPAKIEVIRVAP